MEGRCERGSVSRGCTAVCLGTVSAIEEILVLHSWRYIRQSHAAKRNSVERYRLRLFQIKLNEYILEENSRECS